ncbi:fido domain-containing protein [Cercophora newfieldiana]|uniref:Fido domain-containing protein n=1 Tax=Cercophora newfieldiana TaxID=92897 RepID=A0AA39Y592_9PEZI|nr:fido domain-containing protein [Cercophora newfieldiana]
MATPPTSPKSSATPQDSQLPDSPLRSPRRSPRKSGHHKRASLGGIFDHLNIASSSSGAHSRPIMAGINLARSIREKFQSIHQPDGTIRTRAHQVEATFTIRMDDAYDYNLLGDDVDPDDLHSEMAQFSASVADILNTSSLNETSQENDHRAADEYLLDALARMVFGSNAIENAGSDLDITLKICRAIFKGEFAEETIHERTPEYEALKRDLIQRGLPAGTPYILRSRQEIVQHALAARHIMTEVFLRDKDLSEETILKTHSILTDGVDHEDGTDWAEYSGKYREVSVGAGLHVFTPPGQVPREMSRMISRLKRDLILATEEGVIDPVALATKYCHIFVNIRPFLDGNGRMCRLILNALLLKYGSFLACMGQEDSTRDEYLSIAARASMSESSSSDEWGEDDKHAPKLYKELASFKLKHAHDGFKQFIGSLRGKHHAKDAVDE